MVLLPPLALRLRPAVSSSPADTQPRVLQMVSRSPVLQRLFRKGIKLHCDLRVTALRSTEAVVENVWSNREETLGPYDAFVYAYGGQAVDDLSKRLAGKVARVDLIGDAFAPRTIQHAILEGHRLARLL